MKIAFLTLGCKVNYYETEKMRKQFEAAGHQTVSFSELADVYVVNTCTVTNMADRKSRKMLHRARRLNPNALVVAAGCYVDSARKKGEQDGSVDVFLSNKEKEDITAVVEKCLEERKVEATQNRGRADVPLPADGHTRAYIKVQNGCNQFCTYCIIPYVRGELSSREDGDILQEVRQLASEGYHELVVTGIHLSSFGVDRTEEKLHAGSFLELGGKPLLTLLQEIGGVDGIERIRLGSLEPRIITEEFVRGLADIPKLCPHFHLSLQSGCDTVLKRMNRHYTTSEYMEKLNLLRRHFEHPAITTDIIVGFPQETEEEFRATCEFARDAAFAQIHVFKYSRRHGTVADSMEGQIEEQVKAERSDILLETGEELQQEYQRFFAGREELVLLEETSDIDGKKYLTGYNERYVRIAVPVENTDKAEEKCNSIVPVCISERLTGEVLLAEMPERDDKNSIG